MDNFLWNGNLIDCVYIVLRIGIIKYGDRFINGLLNYLINEGVWGGMMVFLIDFVK